MEQKLQIRYTYYPDKPPVDFFPGPSQQGVFYALEEKDDLLIARVAVGETNHAALMDLSVGSHESERYRVKLPTSYGGVAVIATASWPHHIGYCEPAYINAGIDPKERIGNKSADQLAIRIGHGVLAAAKLSFENIELSHKKYTKKLAQKALIPIYEAERQRLVYVHN